MEIFHILSQVADSVLQTVVLRYTLWPTSPKGANRSNAPIVQIKGGILIKYYL